MIRHGFKIIWNQKRKYGFIVFELFVIFLIIISTMVYMIEQVSTYLEGTGCNINRVYCMDLSHQLPEEVAPHDHFQKINKRVERLEGVEAVSFSLYATPHMMQSSSSSFKYGEYISQARIHHVDEQFQKVLQLDVVRGHWFEFSSEMSASLIPAVINRQMAEELFGDANPLGEEISGMEHQYEVIGVVGHYKPRDYIPAGPSIFVPMNHAQTGVYGSADLLVRHEKGFYPRPRAYAQEIFSVLSRDRYKIERSMKLTTLKEMSNSNYSGDMLFVVLVVGFLIFNLILGLIGILGYNVNRRWSEMGIRRAVGASRSLVRRQILSELLAITVMALIPAFLLVVQIPALDLLPVSWALFSKSMLGALVVILFLVFVSVFYPAVLASKIPIAEALKEE